jgi:hypothetical protein
MSNFSNSGGLSAAATITAIAGSVGSAGVSILAGYGSSVDGKAAIERIKKCQWEHEASVNRRKEEMKEMLDIINKVGENINFDVAIISTFAFFIGSGKSCKSVYDVISTTNAITNAIKIGEIQRILAPTGLTITTNMAGTSMQVAFPSAQAIGAMTEAQKAAFIALSKSPEKLLGNTVASAFGKVCFAVSVLFTVADVISLVDTWKSDHPYVNPIDNFIDGLNLSITSDENTLNLIRQMEASIQ